MTDPLQAIIDKEVPGKIEGRNKLWDELWDVEWLRKIEAKDGYVEDVPKMAGALADALDACEASTLRCMDMMEENERLKREISRLLNTSHYGLPEWKGDG